MKYESHKSLYTFIVYVPVGFSAVVGISTTQPNREINTWGQ